MVVDDDHIYGPGLIETMMRASVTLPGTAIGAQGWVSLPGRDPQAFPSFVVDTGYAVRTPVLSSYLGNLYRRYFFDAAVQHPEAAHAMCRLHDDMWCAQPAARTVLCPRVPSRSNPFS